MRKRLLQIFVIFFTSLITLGFIEIFLIIKNKLIIDYDIEMWKYSKLLKERSSNPSIGHVHKKNKSAFLQNVNIKINNLGIRGDDINVQEINRYDKKVLILGSSVALGWGVDQEKTFSYIVQKKLNEQDITSIVLNAGIGNYNTTRYVSNYFENLSYLKPDEIFVLFFVNDTEILENTYNNFFIKNFQFAVLLWKYILTFDERLNIQNIEKYYLEKYEENFDGFVDAKKNLVKLNNHCTNQNINCTLVLMPDINNLNPYKFDFINEKMISFSEEISLNYLDLLPFFEAYVSSNSKDGHKKLLNKYRDPHPNQIGHQIIANALLEYLE